MPPDARALTTCGRQVMQSTNGHGIRWARERCTVRLIEQGSSPAIARACAQAMVVVIAAIKAKAVA